MNEAMRRQIRRSRPKTDTQRRRERVVKDIESIIYGLAFLTGGVVLSSIGELLCRWAGVG